MKKQTFIIEVNWCDRMEPSGYYKFFRVGCKRKETCLKYLSSWVSQAEEQGLQRLYRCFFKHGATYQVTETPDGWNKGAVVLSGLVSDLKKSEFKERKELCYFELVAGNRVMEAHIPDGKDIDAAVDTARAWMSENGINNAVLDVYKKLKYDFKFKKSIDITLS